MLSEQIQKKIEEAEKIINEIEIVKKLIEFKDRPPGKAISVFCNFDFVWYFCF